MKKYLQHHIKQGRFVIWLLLLLAINTGHPPRFRSTYLYVLNTYTFIY